jgi:hypothetical protein
LGLFPARVSRVCSSNTARAATRLVTRMPNPPSNTRAMSVHFDIDLVTPDALAPTTTDAEIRRWWQSAFDTRVAEFLKS